MELQKELTIALLAMNFKAEEVHLETTQSGGAGGHIVSPLFEGKTQKVRQDELWAGLRSRLKPEQLTKIIALLTVTPKEVED